MKKVKYFYSVEIYNGINFHGIEECEEIKNNEDLMKFTDDIKKVIKKMGIEMHGGLKILAFNRI